MAVAAHAKFTIPTGSSFDRKPSRQETLQVLNKVVNDDARTEKEKIDVLADLGALQREVDALRRSFEHHGTKDDDHVEYDEGEEADAETHDSPERDGCLDAPLQTHPQAAEDMVGATQPGAGNGPEATHAFYMTDDSRSDSIYSKDNDETNDEVHRRKQATPAANADDEAIRVL